MSDALHDRLTQRFVDRRTQALLKGLQSDEQLATIEDDGAILVDGHPVGRLEGLRYVLEPGAADAERRALISAARRAIVPEMNGAARRRSSPRRTTPSPWPIAASSLAGRSARRRSRSAGCGPDRRRSRRASSCWSRTV